MTTKPVQQKILKRNPTEQRKTSTARKTHERINPIRQVDEQIRSRKGESITKNKQDEREFYIPLLLTPNVNSFNNFLGNSGI
jgi:hypothetical protein